MVEPVPVINTTKPATVAQRGRYYEVEVEIDSDNPVMFRTQDVISGAGTGAALVDSGDNSTVDYFGVNFYDTAGTLRSHIYETDRVELTYAKGRVSNERGVDRNTTVYRFICRGNRALGTTTMTPNPGQAAADEQYTGITSINMAGTTVSTILWYEWEFLGQGGGDILTPRFTPNTYESVGVTEWPGKYWRIRVGLDSYTDALSATHINDDGANATLNAFVVTLSKAGGGTRTHTYEASKVYVSNVDPFSEAGERNVHNVGVVEFICIGTRSDG